ncbi:MAG: hypothetical protein PHI28_06885 [Mangrovibacterium sp.]|nr:hypothetical protein [Mangrovibacterium sp.]
MLHKTDGSAWTEEGLSPVRDIRMMEVMPSGSPLGTVITLSNHDQYEIDFKDIDGKRSC